jgi:purine-binding chemotaxis protein CheW
MTSTSSNQPTGENPDVAAHAEHEHRETASHLIVRLAESVYALAAEHVDLVAADITALAVPTAPTHFLGVVHLRGRIIPVIDLPGLLRLAPKDRAPSDQENVRRLVALSADGRPFAVVVDEVLGLHDVPVDEIVAAPKSEDDHAAESVVTAQFDGELGTTAVLDLSAVVSLLIGNQPKRSD